MKVFTTILKIVAVIAAIAGIIYVVATYGDKIVAWARKLLRKGQEYCCCKCDEDFDDILEAEDLDFEG
ncbi:MAG: hypothetical protein IKU57_00540 [Oscillospiraceae bacterium]|nr:hypothetical protein [Oscillospiraceae bacterium]